MAKAKETKATEKTAGPKKAAAPKAPVATSEKAAAAVQGNHRTIVGVVVSDKMDKTIVVKVDRRVRHTLYQKYVTKSGRYQAHDEKGVANVGDLVQLVETRPMSKHKRWALQRVVRKSGLAPEINV